MSSHLFLALKKQQLGYVLLFSLLSLQTKGALFSLAQAAGLGLDPHLQPFLNYYLEITVSHIC